MSAAPLSPVLSSQRLRLALWGVLVAQACALPFLVGWTTPDSPRYLALADALAGVTSASGPAVVFPDAMRSSGYPVFLYLALHVARLPLGVVIALQMGLSLASVLLVERLLRAHDASPLLFLALVLVYPFAAAYSVRVQTEAWSTLLVTAMACVLASRLRLNAGIAIAVGGLGGLAMLIRPDLALLPLLASAIVLLGWGAPAAPLARRVRSAGLIVVAAVATTLPYAVCNRTAFGTFSPLPPAGGLGHALYSATWEAVLPREDVDRFFYGDLSDTLRRSGYLDEVVRINRSIGAPPYTHPLTAESYEAADLKIRANAAFGRAGVERVLASPGRYVAHVAVGWWRLWNTDAYPLRVPPALAFLLRAISAFVWAAGFCGVAYLLVRGRRDPLVVPAILLLYFPGIHAWLHHEARYTAPGRLLLAACASVAVSALVGWALLHVRHRRTALAR
jgi:hypothetical protein